MQTNSISVQNGSMTTKNYIIGKLWVRSKDGAHPGVLRINRDLPQNLVIHPGATLILHENSKREGKIDPDYSVSVILPSDTANRLIAVQRRKSAVRPSEQLVAFAVD